MWKFSPCFLIWTLWLSRFSTRNLGSGLDLSDSSVTTVWPWADYWPLSLCWFAKWREEKAPTPQRVGNEGMQGKCFAQCGRGSQASWRWGENRWEYEDPLKDCTGYTRAPRALLRLPNSDSGPQRTQGLTEPRSGLCVLMVHSTWGGLPL